MKLELLHRGPEPNDRSRRGPGRAPLLFVHGAFCAAWIWDEHFLSFFAERGFDAHALSLRGHGGSGGHRLLHGASLRDYVRDLEAAVDSLERPPVLIGHSMGGMVVQKYLEHHRTAGAVLMASVPPEGLGSTAWHMMSTRPTLFWEIGLIQTLGTRFATLDGLREAMFSGNATNGEMQGYFRRMQGESQRVILDMTCLDLPLVPLIRDDGLGPMLVLGAEDDAFLSPESVRRTALVYDADLEILPGEAHAMMLGRRWENAAMRILRFLDDYEL